MKKVMIALAMAVVAGSLTAGDCKNCGSDTYKSNVYRCNKCRTFFCDNCRGGDDLRKEAGMYGLGGLVNSLENLSADIICPECGAKDKLTCGSVMENGNIRLIKKKNQ